MELVEYLYEADEEATVGIGRPAFVFKRGRVLPTKQPQVSRQELRAIRGRHGDLTPPTCMVALEGIDSLWSVEHHPDVHLLSITYVDTNQEELLYVSRSALAAFRQAVARHNPGYQPLS